MATLRRIGNYTLRLQPVPQVNWRGKPRGPRDGDPVEAEIVLPSLKKKFVGKRFIELPRVQQWDGIQMTPAVLRRMEASLVSSPGTLQLPEEAYPYLNCVQIVLFRGVAWKVTEPVSADLLDDLVLAQWARDQDRLARVREEANEVRHREYLTRLAALLLLRIKKLE